MLIAVQSLATYRSRTWTKSTGSTLPIWKAYPMRSSKTHLVVRSNSRLSLPMMRMKKAPTLEIHPQVLAIPIAPLECQRSLKENKSVQAHTNQGSRSFQAQSQRLRPQSRHQALKACPLRSYTPRSGPLATFEVRRSMKK